LITIQVADLADHHRLGIAGGQRIQVGGNRGDVGRAVVIGATNDVEICAAGLQPVKEPLKVGEIADSGNVDDDLCGGADRLHCAVAAVDQAGDLGEVVAVYGCGATEPMGQSIPELISLPTCTYCGVTPRLPEPS